MSHITGSLTYTFDTSQEFTEALTALQANVEVTVESSDEQARTITILIDVTR